MCTGAEIAGLALAVGGTVMQQQSADAATKDQQKIIANAQNETSNNNEKRARTITDFADDTFNPTKRNTRYEDAATENESSLVQALLDANGGTHKEVQNATEGKVSDDYMRGKATATANATEDIIKRTKLLGRNNAGSLLYNKESLDGANLSSDLGAINSSQQRTNSAANSGLSNAYDRGSLAGGLLTALGANAGAIFKSKPTPTSTTAGSGV